MTTIIARSAESVHWYRQDGGPQYTVKAKDGNDRPTTIRDARDRKSTRLNSSHIPLSRMPSSA